MSRCGYSEDLENWTLIRWRGQVASAVRGKRGQAFLRELVEALDALPEKRLIAHELESDGNVCAIGSVGLQRGVDMSTLDPDDSVSIASVFGIADPLVREIEAINDEEGWSDTPEQRWQRMRNWAVSQLKEPLPELTPRRSPRPPSARGENRNSSHSEGSGSPNKRAGGE